MRPKGRRGTYQRSFWCGKSCGAQEGKSSKACRLNVWLLQMPRKHLDKAQHTGSSADGKQSHSEIFLYYSVTLCTVHVPCWANYWLKMLLAKGECVHYVAASTQAQLLPIYAVWKAILLWSFVCACHQEGLLTYFFLLLSISLSEPHLSPSIPPQGPARRGTAKNRAEVLETEILSPVGETRMR